LDKIVAIAVRVYALKPHDDFTINASKQVHQWAAIIVHRLTDFFTGATANLGSAATR
jgi:hypothetical protein